MRLHILNTSLEVILPKGSSSYGNCTPLSFHNGKPIYINLICRKHSNKVESSSFSPLDFKVMFVKSFCSQKYSLIPYNFNKRWSGRFPESVDISFWKKNPWKMTNNELNMYKTWLYLPKNICQFSWHSKLQSFHLNHLEQ